MEDKTRDMTKEEQGLISRTNHMRTPAGKQAFPWMLRWSVLDSDLLVLTKHSMKGKVEKILWVFRAVDLLAFQIFTRNNE